MDIKKPNIKIDRKQWITEKEQESIPVISPLITRKDTVNKVAEKHAIGKIQGIKARQRIESQEKIVLKSSDKNWSVLSLIN